MTPGIPIYFWLIFLFLIGASTGSFLNVVVYRMPLDLSLMRPGSHCTACKHPLAWYDNIPVFGWFLLGGKCRYCGAKFSIRYAAVEFLTAFLFVALYWLYFQEHCRSAQQMPVFEHGGWLIYLAHITLICVLLASSLIDAEHWIIPLPLCYTAAFVGVVVSAFSPYVISGPADQFWRLTPWAGTKTAALGLGALAGLILSMILVGFGVIKRSFDAEISSESPQNSHKINNDNKLDDNFNIRAEMVRELAFLTLPVVLAVAAYWFFARSDAPSAWWAGILADHRWLAGVSGSVYGFVIGGAVVWLTRILGSLVFGKEAMGLGDVHLMAAVGAVLGWSSPTIAFFVAPFFGLGWAVARLIVHRSREIPYGPFLSMATLLVMILHDRIVNYLLASLANPMAYPN